MDVIKCLECNEVKVLVTSRDFKHWKDKDNEYGSRGLCYDCCPRCKG